MRNRASSGVSKKGGHSHQAVSQRENKGEERGGEETSQHFLEFKAPITEWEV